MILSAIFILLFDNEKKTKKEKKKRSTWIRLWLARREERGFYHQLLREISVEDSAAFHELLRVTKTQFHVLVDTLSPRLAKRDTVMRDGIKPGEISALALRFLATSESFRSLHFQFRLGRETISQAISEVCLAIYEEMGTNFGNLKKGGTCLTSLVLLMGKGLYWNGRMSDGGNWSRNSFERHWRMKTTIKNSPS